MSRLIAEIGANHNGDMDLAAHMIHAAAQAGADVVKFQSWRAERLRADWPDRGAALAYYRQREISLGDHRFLMRECEASGVEFLTTVFDLATVDELDPLLTTVKIGSAEATNWPLVDACLARFERVIISTGMHEWPEVVDLYHHIRDADALERVTVLHCVSLYPCPPEHVNMFRMARMMKLFPSVGFSDHTLGTDAAKLAINLGAACVEKHFTTDRSLPGKDQHVSATPEGFAEIAAWRGKVGTMMLDRDGFADEGARTYIGKWS